MPKKPPLHRPPGYAGGEQQHRQYDIQRGSARERGYTSQWERARKAFLSTNPFCVMCEREGRISPATIVDHIAAHRSDRRLFWDRNNWQALCKPHHDRDKQREERGTEREDVT